MRGDVGGYNLIIFKSSFVEKNRCWVFDGNIIDVILSSFFIVNCNRLSSFFNLEMDGTFVVSWALIVKTMTINVVPTQVCNVLNEWLVFIKLTLEKNQAFVEDNLTFGQCANLGKKLFSCFLLIFSCNCTFIYNQMPMRRIQIFSLRNKMSLQRGYESWTIGNK